MLKKIFQHFFASKDEVLALHIETCALLDILSPDTPTTENAGVFVKEFWVDLLDKVSDTAPDAHAASAVCNEIKDFKAAEKTPVEIYDFLAAKSAEWFHYGLISGTVRQLFNVNAFYVRPE